MERTARIGDFGRAGLAWRTARRLLGWPGRVLTARAAMLRLGSLSDHELRDIGLMRQDLIDASSLDLDADPTLLLAERARERRRRR